MNVNAQRIRLVTILLSCLAWVVFVVSVRGAWTPPVGIPHPPFGITNTVWDLTNQTYNFGTGAVAYPIGPNGPYTHWVDNTHPSATDAANTFGSPSLPRLTIPQDVGYFQQQGNILEIHGGPYISSGGGVGIWYWTPDIFGTNNSVTRPTYIRGGSWTTRPMIIGAYHQIPTSFLVFENLCITNTGQAGHFSIQGRYVTPNVDVRGVCVRSNEFVGNGTSQGNGAAVGIGDTADTTVQVSNTVVFGNWIHHLGTTNQGVENDFLGVKVTGEDVYHTWVVDNHIHHMGGDSVSPGSNSYDVDPDVPGNQHVADISRFVFIGRNNMHDCGENSVDVKVCNDVVVSENLMASNHQAGFVVHYQPSNIVVIANIFKFNNRSHPVAISDTGCYELGVGGNVFVDEISGIERAGGDSWQWNNTFVRTESGSYSTGTTTNRLVNNIFYDCDGQVNFDTATAAVSYSSNGMIWPAVLAMNWQFPYMTLGALQAGSGTFKNFTTNDPLFVDGSQNNFELTNVSPARGAALHSFSLFMSNRHWSCFGAAIPASTNLGAWNGLTADSGSDGGGSPSKRTARGLRVITGRLIR